MMCGRASEKFCLFHLDVEKGQSASEANLKKLSKFAAEVRKNIRVLSTSSRFQCCR